VRKKKLHPVIEEVLRKHEQAAERYLRKLNVIERAPCGIGFLTLVTVDEHGNVRDTVSGANIVVNLGRSSLAHLLAGDSSDNHKIVAMVFGDGSTPPAITDTGLSGSTIIQKDTSYDFPDGATGLKVRFTAVVGSAEGNGAGSQIYREAALVKGNGDIFSRKVSGSITKDNTVVLTALYTFIF